MNLKSIKIFKLPWGLIFAVLYNTLLCIIYVKYHLLSFVSYFVYKEIFLTWFKRIDNNSRCILNCMMHVIFLQLFITDLFE